MNLKKYFIILCVVLADSQGFLRIVDGKPAKIGNDISFLEEFLVFRRNPPISTIYDDDSEERDEERSKESDEKEYKDDLIINGIISHSTSEATSTAISPGDDLEGPSPDKASMNQTHAHTEDHKMTNRRLVRAADSNKNKNNKKKPTNEQDALDEAMEFVGADTSTAPTMTSAVMPTEKKKYRRHSEVAKWPPALPYAGIGPMDVHTLGVNSPKMDKSINAEGGIISAGKVGMSSEDNEMESNSTDSSLSSMDNGTTEDAEHVTVTYAPESESEDIMTPSHKSDKKKTDKDKPVLGGGKAGTKTTMKPPGQRDISGSSGGNVIKKPGKCRPLTSGLACIALSPDASQCSTDNSCPSTKKCCFYGCKPYQGIGICEFPVMS